VASALVAPALASPLADRIGHYVPEKAQRFTGVHDGAGSMKIEPSLDDKSLSTNLLFWHRGVIEPSSGIGEHFHNRCEEMLSSSPARPSSPSMAAPRC
jgi:hypothetical protein